MRRNVLIVDDDLDMRELISFSLEQAGFAVRAAADGYSALAELQANHYDLIILDLTMPHVSGVAMLRALRSNEAFKTLPVIVLTGRQNKDDLVLVKRYGVSDYVLKPANREDLLARVERILGGRPQFEEVSFDKEDPITNGSIIIPLKLISVSLNGVVLSSSVQLEKKSVVDCIGIKLFQYLQVEQMKFSVTDCFKTENNQYGYFLSFLGMNKSDQEKVRKYILDKSFEKKRQAA